MTPARKLRSRKAPQWHECPRVRHGRASGFNFSRDSFRSLFCITEFMSSARKKPAIAILVHNEERNLPERFQSVETVAAALLQIEVEVLLIDHQSADQSDGACVARAEANPSGKYLHFSSNFRIEPSFPSAQ